MMHRTALRHVVFAAAVFLLVATPAVEAGPPKWEYRVVNAALKTRPLEQMLNSMGAEGWELVGFTRNDVAVFKRRER